LSACDVVDGARNRCPLAEIFDAETFLGYVTGKPTVKLGPGRNWGGTFGAECQSSLTLEPA
jgi:hypothetical protein